MLYIAVKTRIFVYTIELFIRLFIEKQLAFSYEILNVILSIEGPKVSVRLSIGTNCCDSTCRGFMRRQHNTECNTR